MPEAARLKDAKLMSQKCKMLQESRAKTAIVVLQPYLGPLQLAFCYFGLPWPTQLNSA